ncbi:hypothetical protein EJ02DRAFT_457956 [Clathrospora elynae]|uniref:RING-type domain-containing protein n=1 Tax=Clathrospora elynae TaxID=706981 RepID=A0A6A5SFZ2_9PLEO|nr:hypothetical protein EJ02DRAFT_457956 [Clathrospora elynae]
MADVGSTGEVDMSLSSAALPDDATQVPASEDQHTAPRDSLPHQKHFLSHDLVLSADDTELPRPGIECGVCLEELVAHTQSDENNHSPSTLESGSTSTVVFLKPCTHFFHDKCIRQWHNSTRPERNTCPICRLVLFVADPLTAAQIRQLHGDSRPLGPYRRLGPNDVLINWEAYIMDVVASQHVRRELDRVLVSGGKHHWVEICKDVRNSCLEVGGTLRHIFEPYRDTFMLVLLAIPMMHAIIRNDNAVRNRGLAEFSDWCDEARELLGTERMLNLSMEMRRNGLFESDVHRVVTLPTIYIQARRESIFRVEEIRAELALQRARRSMRGRLARIAGAVLPQCFVKMLAHDSE